MKKVLKIIATIQFKQIYILLFLVVITNLTAHTQTTNSSERANQTLVEILINLENDYQIFFSYNTQILSELIVEFEYDSTEPIEELLTRLLKKVKLQYESYSDKYFVIYRKSEQNKNEVSQLRKHFNTIEKIETQRREDLKKDIKKSINQSYSIKGKVQSSEGESLVGANIQLINNPNKGTSTDANGLFSMNAKLPVKLLISYIGYTPKEITINKPNTISTIILEDGFFIEKVIINSRRRKENLQDAPLSITAIQGNFLESSGNQEIDAIGKMAPNLVFSTAGTVSGSSSAAVVYIRGIGQNDYVPVSDPGVGIYVDEVYLGRTVGAVLNLLDLKQVEVIRGPQGTLFGRNTIGGAISLTSNDPARSFKGKISVLGGSYAQNDVTINLSGPINKHSGMTFTAIRRKRKGYVERVNIANDNLGDENAAGAKLNIFLGQTNSKIKLKIIADYFREREESAPEQNLFFHSDRPFPLLWNTGTGFSTATDWEPGDLTSGTNIYDERQNLGPFKSGETSLSKNDLDSYGISTNLSYHFTPSSVARLIVAYRNIHANFARQVDGSPLSIFENRDRYSQDQFSADLKYNKSSKQLNLVAGFFYFNENVNNQFGLGGVLDGIIWPLYFGGLVHNYNYASYGELVYKPTARWAFTGGLRYTYEVKQAQPDAFQSPNTKLGEEPIKPPIERNPDKTTTNEINTNGELVSFDPIENPNRLIDKIWQEYTANKMTWRFNTAYKLTKTINFYTSISTGFKSGGFEWRVAYPYFYEDVTNDIDGDGDGDLPRFNPETVTAFELGSKILFPKKNLRLNAAAFYTLYKDMQIATNPDNSLTTFQTNAGNSRIKGLEIEITWAPSNSILFNLGYGFTDAKYHQLNDEVTISKQDQFILTPKHMGNFNVTYIQTLRKGKKLSFNLGGHAKSMMHFEAKNSAYVFDDGYLSLDSSLGYKLDTKWNLKLGVKNLTNSLYLIGGDANTVIGYENGIYARPRNFYAKVDYNF